MYVQKFEDLNKSDIAIAGGKGANLGELTQAGIPVPPGFVVTAETYQKFMEDTGINDKVLDILDKIDINDTKALQAAAEEIKSIIVETPIPDDMIMFIKEAYSVRGLAKMTQMWPSGHPLPPKTCLKLLLQVSRTLSST